MWLKQAIVSDFAVTRLSSANKEWRVAAPIIDSSMPPPSPPPPVGWSPFKLNIGDFIENYISYFIEKWHERHRS